MIPVLPQLNLTPKRRMTVSYVLKIVALVLMLFTWKFGYAGGYVQEVGVPECHGMGS